VFASQPRFRLVVRGSAQGYSKWLSQYGDDSIAQITGTHVIVWGISQVAMKFIEDQRVGLEPIEKSTRYVNFGTKVGGRYLYYIPRPDLERCGLLAEYTAAMDHLFDTYVALLGPLQSWLKQNFRREGGDSRKESLRHVARPASDGHAGPGGVPRKCPGIRVPH
jgi:thymidylate synthase ThyX